ncbi:unnamed protein product [Pedinophyceae sp. YPF-701]|nr:unnamed protein product [Pedinophyceae sp. YPF-701]
MFSLNARITAPSCVASPRARTVARAQHKDNNYLVYRRDLTIAAPLYSAALLAALTGAPEAGAKECEVGEPAFGGIRFCETKEGTGPSPVKGALVRCHYTGRLASNNRVFDSSYERGRPLPFTVGVRQVIQGWDVGILGSEDGTIPPMKEGGKRRLYIPAALAYGDRGAGGVIPPGADLVFDVELLPRKK